MPTTLDLRGIPCPLSWARAKVHIETLSRGALLELLVDEPRAVRDLPRAAEASGHHVVEITTTTDATRITIEV